MTIADTGEPVVLPFRMSCFVLSNLVVTAGMLTPGLKVRSFIHIGTAGHRIQGNLADSPRRRRPVPSSGR